MTPPPIIPSHMKRYDDETPMSRRLEQENRLTNIEASLSHQDGALEQIQASLLSGFSRIDVTHGEIRERLAAQHDHLNSLLETRKLQSSIVKWIAGVAAAVIVAVVLTMLRLRG